MACGGVSVCRNSVRDTNTTGTLTEALPKRGIDAGQTENRPHLSVDAHLRAEAGSTHRIKLVQVTREKFPQRTKFEPGSNESVEFVPA